MLPPNQFLEEFQKNFSEFIAKTPAAEIERNMKAFLTQAFGRLDLITREEFEVQAAMVQRALERVNQLEARLAALEGKESDDPRALGH